MENLTQPRLSELAAAVQFQVPEAGVGAPQPLGWKFQIYELYPCQERCQLAVLACDWMSTLVQPIRSQLIC